jgi:hypothetical protein
VDRYSLWNEPNYPSWLAPKKQSPKIYRALYTAGYKAIKSADPSAQVLIGETVPYGGKASKKVSGIGTPPLAWLRKLACVNAKYKRVGHCKPLKADGYAHHPYEFTMAPTAKAKAFKDDNAPIQAISRLRLALNKLRSAHALSTPKGRPLDIYLTESGYFVNGNRAVAAPDRAKWLPQQFQVAARQPRVREMLQYNVFVPDNTTFSTGLLDLSGAPLPEYGTLLSWTQGAASSGLIKRNTGPISLPPAPNDGTSATPSGGGSGGGAGNGGGGTGTGGGGTGGVAPPGGGPPSGTPGIPSLPSPPPGCKIAVASVCVVPA